MMHIIMIDIFWARSVVIVSHLFPPIPQPTITQEDFTSSSVFSTTLTTIVSVIILLLIASYESPMELNGINPTTLARIADCVMFTYGGINCIRMVTVVSSFCYLVLLCILSNS